MDIIWHGHACFELISDNTTIVTDPFEQSLGLAIPELSADIITVSHNSVHHNATNLVHGDAKVVNRPGEYEIREAFIIGSAIYPPANQAKKMADPRNIVFFIEIDGITVCHMGDIRHVPTQSQMENFSDVDILLLPVGNGKSITAAQASETISLIEPSIVVPMHYALPGITIPLEPLDKFLKGMGLPTTEPLSKLRINANNLPDETQTVILAPQA